MASASRGPARPSNRSCFARGRRACSAASRARPALLIEGIASTADGRPVEFGRTYVRGDRTRYYVERVVVRPHWLRDEVATQEEESDRAIATDSVTR